MSRRKSKKGRAVKKNKQATQNESDEIARAPHSFVIHRGAVGQYIQDLTRDFRKVMEPYTASALKVRRKNVVKDFVSIAGLLHVSHLVVFTQTDNSGYMRFARLPRGPTLTFKIHNYSLSRDVVSMLKKQYVVNKEFKHSPLIILNSFSGEGPQMKLMASMFQNMFPVINLTKVNLDTVCRCVMFNYNPETKLIDFRHYGIRAVPVGLSRGVKKIVQGKVPNLAKFDDVSEFIMKAELLSESEAEDDPKSHVILPQKLSSRGNMASNQSAIRLTELGPRLSLQLIKVETGLMEGDIIFHEFVHKTAEEIKIMNKRREEKRKTKELRKRIQEQNKQKKVQFKEELKQKSIEGMKKSVDGTKKIDTNKKMLTDADKVEEDEDNDADWFRKEVGEEPDQDLFAYQASSGGGIKRRKSVAEMKELKKRKLDGNESSRFRRTESKFGNKRYGDDSSKFNNKKFGRPESKFGNRKFGDDSSSKFNNRKFGRPESKFGNKSFGGERSKFNNKKFGRPESKFGNRKFGDDSSSKFNNKKFGGRGSKGKTMGSKVTKGRRHR